MSYLKLVNTLGQCFSTFGTVGPVDEFFRQIGPANVVYFDQQMGAMYTNC